MNADVLRSLAMALATGDPDAARPLLTPDAEWEVVGHATHRGRDGILATLATARKTPQVTLDQVLTEGNAGAVHGRIVLSPTHVRRFCDLYELTGTHDATVRRIVSYDIRLP